MNEGRPMVRIMTWNIHGAVGPDRRRDLSRIVDLVERHEPDIVALQEVDSRRRRADAEPAFEVLARTLGEHAAEARLIAAADGHYGHVVISRWPMSGTICHDVSVGRREPRAAIETNIATGCGPLHVVAAHLGLGFGERRRQAALIAAICRSASTPSVVLGDFNDWRARGCVQRAVAQFMPARTHHKTFPAFLPLLALDRIYGRPHGIIVRSWTDAHARFASDHLPVIAELDLGVSYPTRPVSPRRRSRT